jgi:hypothetical protein
MTLDSQPPLTQHAPLHNATFPAIEELSGTMWPYRKTNDKRLKQKNTERSGSDRITSYASRKKMEVTSSDQSSLKGHCTAWDMYPLTSPPLGNRGSDNPNPRHHLPQPPSLSLPSRRLLPTKPCIAGDGGGGDLLVGPHVWRNGGRLLREGDGPCIWQHGGPLSLTLRPASPALGWLQARCRASQPCEGPRKPGRWPWMAERAALVLAVVDVCR